MYVSVHTKQKTEYKNKKENWYKQTAKNWFEVMFGKSRPSRFLMWLQGGIYMEVLEVWRAYVRGLKKIKADIIINFKCKFDKTAV